MRRLMTVLALAGLILTGCSTSDVREWLTTPAPRDDGIILVPPTTTTTTTTTTTSTTQPPPPPPPAADCDCDTKPALCEPVKGEECPTPWGMDIRFLGWSRSRNDWIFIGHIPGSVTKDGKMLTGYCVRKDGIQYHYIGYKAPSSEGKLIRERTGQYRETYRLYYEPRRKGQ